MGIRSKVEGRRSKVGITGSTSWVGEGTFDVRHSTFDCRTLSRGRKGKPMLTSRRRWRQSWGGWRCWGSRSGRWTTPSVGCWARRWWPGRTCPPFANSAMDGFAVRSADVAGASVETPVNLQVLADQPAGAVASVEVRPGTAVRIMTGARMPAGADTVVPVEHTSGSAQRGAGAAPGEARRQRAAGRRGRARRRVGAASRGGAAAGRAGSAGGGGPSARRRCTAPRWWRW